MDSKEIEQIWKDYHPKVYGYFYKRVNQKSEVEDLTSATMAILVQKLQQEEIVNLPAFVWKIAQNQLLYFVRY